MSILATTTTFNASTFAPPHIESLFDKCQQMMENYWADNPDLYRIVLMTKTAMLGLIDPSGVIGPTDDTFALPAEMKDTSILSRELRGAPLRAKIRERQ